MLMLGPPCERVYMQTVSPRLHALTPSVCIRLCPLTTTFRCELTRMHKRTATLLALLYVTLLINNFVDESEDFGPPQSILCLCIGLQGE